jgi:hypothetical protein
MSIPAAPFCQPDPPKACANRLRAVIEGTFVIRATGWHWLDCRTPNQPWRRCPWCDGVLANPLRHPEQLLDRIFSDADDEC